MESYDAIVVGGGPAGSTSARFLSRAGLRVAVLDRARFPRVKLCAGWVSVPIWDVLEIAPDSYPRGLWEWNRCHVRFGGETFTIGARGYFIRRAEFDDWLLRQSGADVVEGHRVQQIERDGDDWVVDGAYRARYLIGAGGTHCPVARALFPPKAERPVGAQEIELEAPAEEIAAARVGADGEPELLLHDDLRGYSWNIPKSGWLNVGSGTMHARDVRPAWSRAREYFEGAGHIPETARDALDRAKGHSYYLFDASNLRGCSRAGAFLVGDALGIAHPFTAEGILPAAVSGRLCAEAIAAGEPGSYRRRLSEHWVVRDYSALRRVRSLRRAAPAGNGSAPRVPRRAVAAGFAWMFSGKPLPGGTMLHKSKTVFHAIDEGAETIVRRMVDGSDIQFDGERPFDPQIHDKRFYTRVLRDGELGFGESYMDGLWDCEQLDELCARLVRAGIADRVKSNWLHLLHIARAKAINLQSPLRAFKVGEQHYDIGNDLYEAMLDRNMAYTCGYWRDADDLDAAQEAKLDLVCRKVGLQPGMTVLELGCGWGSFARFAAERYGVKVVGYTVSKQQVALGAERCAGLPVELRLGDYRDATGTFDAVVSIGIMEHVGYKNYGTYFDVVDRCLGPDGIAFVHTIAGNRSNSTTSPWFNKYIFPNANLPSLAQLAAASEGRFIIEDVHNIGPDYDQTLMAWYENFEAAWPRLRERYGDRFYRMWRYYLLSCAGGFRGRYTQLYQIVLTRTGRPQPDCRIV